MNKLTQPTRLAVLLAWLLLALRLPACIWDADTLFQEKLKSPKLAEAILGEPPKPPDPKPLLERIQKLRASPKESDPAWWNDLAGAYLRLGRAKEAADLLEPVVRQFPDNYGVHANLGTAYHLLGRYADAEKEIARDLEINPDAHFGIEKYHLALLQYLMRDKAYQKEHLYVDEFSDAFLRAEWRVLDLMPWEDYQLAYLEANRNSANKNVEAPEYRKHWNLASDTNLVNGVIYMASLNPEEPSCYSMLAVVCLAKLGYSKDLNLALKAIDKAIQKESPQEYMLRQRSQTIREHLVAASKYAKPPTVKSMVKTIFVRVFTFLATCWAIMLITNRLRSKTHNRT